MMEVWLLETYYDDSEAGQYHEIVLHVPRTDIWLVDSGYWEEHLEDARFTKLFWDSMYYKHLLTRLGDI